MKVGVYRINKTYTSTSGLDVVKISDLESDYENVIYSLPSQDL